MSSGAENNEGMSVLDYVYEPSQFSVYVGWVQRSATHHNLRTIRHIKPYPEEWSWKWRDKQWEW